jgi:hypothetical protein
LGGVALTENSETGGSQGTSRLWIFGVVLYALFGGLGVYFMNVFKFPSDSPGGEPPWFFIRRDAITGLFFIPYLVSCIVIGLTAIKRKTAGGAMLIGFAATWSSAPLWNLAVIYLKSDDIFDPMKARTAWPTFESYSGDFLRWGWILLLLAGVMIYKIKSRRAAARPSMSLPGR